MRPSVSLMAISRLVRAEQARRMACLFPRARLCADSRVTQPLPQLFAAFSRDRAEGEHRHAALLLECLERRLPRGQCELVDLRRDDDHLDRLRLVELARRADEVDELGVV